MKKIDTVRIHAFCLSIRYATGIKGEREFQGTGDSGGKSFELD